MAKEDGGPAFPLPLTAIDGGMQPALPGMSLRDWFAGQALAGMHARDSYDKGLATPEQRATVAFIDADTMIAERKKETP